MRSNMTLPWIINSRCFIILLVDTINAHNAPCLNPSHNFIELENDLEEKIHREDGCILQDGDVLSGAP